MCQLTLLSPIYHPKIFLGCNLELFCFGQHFIWIILSLPIYWYGYLPLCVMSCQLQFGYWNNVYGYRALLSLLFFLILPCLGIFFCETLPQNYFDEKILAQ